MYMKQKGIRSGRTRDMDGKAHLCECQFLGASRHVKLLEWLNAETCRRFLQPKMVRFIWALTAWPLDTICSTRLRAASEACGTAQCGKILGHDADVMVSE